VATTTLTGVGRSSVSARWQGWLGLGVTLAAIAVVGIAIGPDVPSWLDLNVASWVDSVYDWTVQNSDSHWLFTRIFNPISSTLEWATDALLWILRALRWPGVLTLIGLIGYRTGGWRTAITGVL
jgi:hypothetical protein